MTRKIISILVIVLFSACCLNLVFADNNTAEITESEDLEDCIFPISISSEGIEFSDGFTGFALDNSKNSITTDDGFVESSSKNSEFENYIKLTIVECYRQDRESEISKIVDMFVDGTYASSNDDIIRNVLDSSEVISDTHSENLSEGIEGTFEFEFLKSSSGNTSDCLAYKVSLKEIIPDETLSAAPDNEIIVQDSESEK